MFFFSFHLIFLLLIIDVKNAEEIDLVCHTLITDTNGNVTNGTCWCKQECGGSMVYEISDTSDIPFAFMVNILTLNQMIANGRQYGDFVTANEGYVRAKPKWFLQWTEDFLVLGDRCTCRIFAFQPSNGLDERTFYAMLRQNIVEMLIQVFYPFFKTLPFVRIVVDKDVPLFLSVFYVFAPVFFAFSVMSIATVKSLIKDKNTSGFTLQLCQLVAGMFSFIFANTILQDALGSQCRYFVCAFNYVADVADLTSVLLSASLLIDRFVSVWRPMTYIDYASHKCSCFVALALTMFSVFVGSFYLVNFAITVSGSALDRALPFIVRTLPLISKGVTAVLCLLCISLEVFLGAGFFLIYNRRMASTAGSAMSANQRPVNLVLLCTVICDMGYVCVIMSYNVAAFFFLSNQADPFWPSVWQDLLLGRFIAATVTPCLTFFGCVLISRPYREAFLSKFCSKRCTGRVRDESRSLALKSWASNTNHTTQNI